MYDGVSSFVPKNLTKEKNNNKPIGDVERQ